MKWSISTKILIPMGVVFVAFFLAQYYLLNLSTQKILLDKAKSRALDMADAAVLALEADLSTSNFDRIATGLASSEDVDFVIFLDKKQRQIVASSSFKYRKDISELPRDLKMRVQFALNTTKWQFIDLGGNDFWFTYNIRTVPLGSKEIHTYLMVTRWSGDSVNKAIAEAAKVHFIYLSLGSLGLALLGFFLFRQVTLKPLNSLIHSINNKQPGKLYENLPSGSNDEFDVLSDSLLEMSDVECKSLAAMEKSKQKAEDMSDLKSAFLANMSHEIRTPINGILGLVQVAQQSSNQDQIQQYLKKIFLSGQTLIGIINDILDFSKLAAGKVSIERLDFCPDQLIEQVIELCQSNADLKDIKLVTRLAKDLPLTLQSDPLRLHQILLNLVNNAVKFTEKGVVSINMSTEYRKDRLWLMVKVVDTGIGIPEDKKALLFEEFVQADGSTTRKYGGTGLGLTISKNLVDLMGGIIGVKSEVGKGSCFYFEVPVNTSSHLELQTKMQDVLAKVNIKPEILDGCGLSTPMLALISRMESFSKGTRVIRLCSLPQYLTFEKQEEVFTVIMGADEALLSGKNLPGYVHPLHSKVNRETLINLLYKGMHTVTGSLDADEVSPDGPVESRVSRVLLVEDNDINAEVILGMLDNEQFDVTHVGNGEEAINYLKNNVADLVLMDVQMPIMDGYQASQEIRQELKLDVPIVGLSANALPEEVARAKEYGMDDYLAKPVMRDALYNTMRQWLAIQS